MGLPGLLLAAGMAFDGDAALRHAAALASLGPHPWGSPRARAAAAYVAAQLKGGGISDVRLEEFEVKGTRGVNVVGVLRGSGPGLVVVGAHHDTAPEAPGAYDDGGGVGVMIEVARVLARRGPPPRTIVFASWDGEEAWSAGVGTTTGSRTYVRGLGSRARDVVAAIAIEMCGWRGGTPVLHPIAYSDPMRPGGHVVTPGWLASAALSGARESGASLTVGDPWLSWLYQPAVRTFRVRLYGDDLSFLQAGVPAVFASDSSFTAFYPWYHQPGDTADRLDAAALARMGEAIRGAVDALARAPLRRDPDPDWFAAFGRVVPRWALLVSGLVAVVPGLVRASASAGRRLFARVVLSSLFAVLVWQDPVPVLWILMVPVLVTGLTPRRPALALALLPSIALFALGAAAWARGFIDGVWLPTWHCAAIAAAIVLAAVRLWPAAGRGVRNGERAGARTSRRGLPRARAAS